MGLSRMCAHCAGEELNAPSNLIYLERKLDGGAVASVFNFRNVIPDVLVPDSEFQCQGPSSLLYSSIVGPSRENVAGCLRWRIVDGWSERVAGHELGT